MDRILRLPASRRGYAADYACGSLISQPAAATYPLNVCLESADLDLESVSVIAATSLPDPYRTVLTNEHGLRESMERVLRTELVPVVLTRWTIGHSRIEWASLSTKAGRHIAMLASATALESLTAEVLHEASCKRLPLTTVLERSGEIMRVVPVRYLLIEPSKEVAAMCEAEGKRLYGRVAVIYSSEGHPIATSTDLVGPVLGH